MKKLLILLLLLSCLTIQGCWYFEDDDEGPPFTIRVIDEAGAPVDSALVVAVLAPRNPPVVYYEECWTDADGYVEIPGLARNTTGFLSKDNFLPQQPLLFDDAVHTLVEAPYRFKLIGTVANNSSLIIGDYIYSFNNEGGCHIYELTNDTITNLGVKSILPQGHVGYSHDLVISGDLLWLSLSDVGVVALDISTLSDPGFAFQIPTTESAWLHAANDSLVLYQESRVDMITVMKFTQDGAYEKYCDVPADGFAFVKLIDSKLFMTDDGGMYCYELKVLDPPVLLTHGQSISGNVRFVDEFVLAQSWRDSDSSSYGVYDISDPRSPVLVTQYEFPVRWVITFSDLNHAFTDFHNGIIFLCRQENSNSFEITGYLNNEYFPAAKMPYLISNGIVYMIGPGGQTFSPL